jgi:hypothetical protein
MDKIRIDFFDILGYLVPGSAFLMVAWVASDSHVVSVWQIYDSIHTLDKKAIFAALFLSYIAGFILHGLGNLMYDIFRFQEIRKYVPSNVQSEWATIREYGEKHIPVLERWYALRALAQNLSAVSLICGLVSLWKFFHNSYYEWIGVFFCSLSICFVLLQRATVFHHYLNDDIRAILKLNLDKKPITQILVNIGHENDKVSTAL